MTELLNFGVGVALLAAGLGLGYTLGWRRAWRRCEREQLAEYGRLHAVVWSSEQHRWVRP